MTDINTICKAIENYHALVAQLEEDSVFTKYLQEAVDNSKAIEIYLSDNLLSFVKHYSNIDQNRDRMG